MMPDVVCSLRAFEHALEPGAKGFLAMAHAIQVVIECDMHGGCSHSN